MKSDQAPTSYGFLLILGFSLVALTCAIDALRAADTETGTSLYSWSLISKNRGLVMSSSGIGIQCKSLEELEHVETIAVCGGDSSHSFFSAQIEQWLKLQARKNKMNGATSDGSFMLQPTVCLTIAAQPSTGNFKAHIVKSFQTWISVFQFWKLTVIDFPVREAHRVLT